MGCLHEGARTFTKISLCILRRMRTVCDKNVEQTKTSFYVHKIFSRKIMLFVR